MKADDLTKAIPPLSAEEQDELAIHEVIIKEGIATFWDVGRSLFTIREKRLYRETHETFEAYCREKWNISRQHAYRLIEATDVFENVSPVGVIANERQARALAHYKKDVQKVVWQMAQTTAPAGNVSASHIKAVGEVLTGILVSGGLDDGSGEVKPLGVLLHAAVTEEVYERLKRQQEYIREGADKKTRAATEKKKEAVEKGQPFDEVVDRVDERDRTFRELMRIITNLVHGIDKWTEDRKEKIHPLAHEAYFAGKALIGEAGESAELIVDNFIRLADCETCTTDSTNIRDICLTTETGGRISTIRLMACDKCVERYQARTLSITVANKSDKIEALA